MAQQPTGALTEVLDELESSIQGDSIGVDDVIEQMGRSSFTSLMLVFSLISTSPASAVPGVTTMVAGIVFILVAQMILGRQFIWLPGFITCRHMASAKLCKGIAWLRPPVRFVERLLKARLTVLFQRPWRWLPLCLILGLTLVMPFLEFIPMSGSVASGVIAILAAGLLTRDGVLVLVALGLLTTIPVMVWAFGVGG